MSSSPGFTDYPEVDIKTHRSIARSTRLIGLFAFLGGLYAFHTMDIPLWAPFVAGLFCELSATNLRLQALEWETQLHAGDGQ